MPHYWSNRYISWQKIVNLKIRFLHIRKLAARFRDQKLTINSKSRFIVERLFYLEIAHIIGIFLHDRLCVLHLHTT